MLVVKNKVLPISVIVGLVASVFVLDRVSLLTPKRAPSSAPSTTYGKIVLDRTGKEWESQQVEEPCILQNPKDPSRLLMFYSGVSSSHKSIAEIGKAWALASDPMNWHQDEKNPIFSPGRGWDSGTIRLDSVLYIEEEDSYYIYYSGTRGGIQDRIGLAIVPAGTDGYSNVNQDTIVRFGDKPVFEPEAREPYSEAMASQAAVFRERNVRTGRWNWYMYYSYRGKDGTLPGIRVATSRDGKKWTRMFMQNDPRKMGQIFESTPDAYYEWHQIFKVGSTYVLSIEVGPDRGRQWRTVLAVSKDPLNGWYQLDPDLLLQTTWGRIYSEKTIFHVATPAFYSIGGSGYLFTQACPKPDSDNYIDGNWDMWGFECKRKLELTPGGDVLLIPGG